VYRLSEAATVMVYAATDPEPAATLGGLARAPYVGVEGGGMLVLPRDTYDRVPLDPRFENWGAEDQAWAAALRTLAGRPYRGSAPLHHLWHPLASRLNAHVGSADNHALLVRYQYAAKAGPEAMAALVAEAAAVTV
jgi:hypothetical protein